MTNIDDFQVGRLKNNLGEIRGIRGKNVTALDGEFEDWKQSVLESLTALFGEDHDLTSRFRKLDFWLIRTGCSGSIHWSRIDRRIFEKDLVTAEDILSDALEDLPRSW